MDERDRERLGERFDALVSKVREDPGLVEHLPEMESHMVREALDGKSVGEIAQDHHVAEGYVWTLMTDVAREAGGEASRVEQGGLGSDTDPGATGGYGDTGFGSLDEEPPMTGTDESYEVEEVEDLEHREHR